MAKKLYVGNLPYALTQDKLRELFGAYGELLDAVVVLDRATGRSRGFGFVEFAEDKPAQKAIDEMNGKEIEGRALVVNEARPPRERRPRQNFQRNY